VTTSKSSQRGKKPVELKAKALSSAEWNYLRSLFLTDGSAKLGLSRVKKRNRVYPHYGVYFYLQGNEGELARRVQWLLARAGLKSRLDKDPSKEMLVVSVFSKSLFNFLPRVETLKRDIQVRDSYFEECGLLTSEGGVPFLAGLIDGDGGCNATVRVKRNGLPYVEKSWRFSQHKLPFLVDYVERIMQSVICPKERSTSTHLDPHRNSWSPNPISVVSFLRAGVDALLAAGISNYSWKVSRWLKRVEELCKWRGSYLTTSEAAKLLNVDVTTIRSWVVAGKLRHSLRRGHWSYVPVEEVERLKKEPSNQA
jgi:excisionase family DNA binding protein